MKKLFCLIICLCFVGNAYSMKYNYVFLQDTLVKIQNLGVDGENIIKEDEVDKDVLSESVKALKDFLDADILNENSQLGKKMKDYIEAEYQRLKQWDTRIKKAEEEK